MKIGIEANHLPVFGRRSVAELLELAHELGFAGVFFKYIYDLSPTLDLGELRHVKAYADELGLYLETGVGRVNPYNTAEAPQVRALGNGDYLLGMERMICAACSIDCTELWAETATSADKPYPSLYKIDRFRTDVDWVDQLQATEKFLHKLAPILRDNGARVNLETHEEITSFEVVRIVEAVGPDVTGILFDTGNIVVRGEDPIAAAKRVAPYVHQTHIKDPLLLLTEYGLDRYMYPCGQGVIEWPSLLAVLGKYAPDLTLTLEDHKGCGQIPLFDTQWQQAHPDLTVAELTKLVQLAQYCAQRIACCEIPDPVTYDAIPHTDHWKERVSQSAAHLHTTLRALGFATPNADNTRLESRTP